MAAITNAVSIETVFENGKIKIYRLDWSASASETTATITPGVGYTVALGSYSYFTQSGNTFTFTLADGGASTYANIMFLTV